MMGHLQTYPGIIVPATTAVFAWVAHGNLCAATRDDGDWSQPAVVFDGAADTGVATAIDEAGDVLVAAGRTIAAGAVEVTAAFRGTGGGGAWTVQGLGSSPDTSPLVSKVRSTDPRAYSDLSRVVSPTA